MWRADSAPGLSRCGQPGLEVSGQGDVSARINQDLTAERTFHIPVFQGQAAGNHEDRPSLERQHLPVTVSPGKYPQLRDLLLNLDIFISSGYWS